MSQHWTREELIKIFELLIEAESPLCGHPEFRKHLDRDENLYANQITRKATNNVAYRTVDFDVNSLTDEEFWEKIEGSKYLDLLEDNAAASIFGMAGKLGLLN